MVRTSSLTTFSFDIYYKGRGEDRFEWDSAKAVLNLKRHGVSFEEAATVFYDPDRLLSKDPWHSTAQELRELAIGTSDTGKELLVVYTERETHITRIISARRVKRPERKRYYENQAKNRET